MKVLIAVKEEAHETVETFLVPGDIDPETGGRTSDEVTERKPRKEDRG